MSTKLMLIDSAHPEETRVAIIEDNRLIDYDVEVASRRQLKGNIYLAKVTRVEPSLQAAFVDYGGNRHGFLAFSEIHPDYYQIPVADREALLAEQAAADAAAKAAEDEREEAATADGATTLTDDDEIEAPRPRPALRHYKIQEVIKRRQIMLVQVVKEERGTKGAALTTYLSLAGRYCVLMPNTTRGGGISRKITNSVDRKRLKSIIGELGVPEGMAVILRTAGAERSKSEVRRDYEYLIRLWNSIRELTLTSMAPTLVYEEGSLIKRSIRDLYDRAISAILIDGDTAYRTSKDFMKLLIPSHARRVQLYEDRSRPLFQRYGVENELEAMHQPTVELKSGGSIVISPTEALVAIDVNSGRATRERHIEETALRTNIEACDEIARQLRLRDLAGLIVVDFIDMENPRNQGQVERRLKDAMKADRARIQLGRISPFGLLELSRQRLRPSIVETSFEICRTCGGTGIRRTTASMALAVLRRIEEAGFEGGGMISAWLPMPVALYLLNQKRRDLVDMEARYGVAVEINTDDSLPPPGFRVERTRGGPVRTEEEPEEEALEAAAGREKEVEATEPDAAGKRGRRRRSRRRKREDGETLPAAEVATDEATMADTGEETGGDQDIETELGAETEGEDGDEVLSETGETGEEEKPARKRRRRGRRGGRRRTTRGGEDGTEAPGDAAADGEAEPASGAVTSETDDAGAADAGSAPLQEVAAEDGASPPTEPVAMEEVVTGEDADRGRVGVGATASAIDAGAGPVVIGFDAGGTVVADAVETDRADDVDGRRRGWWQKLLP